MYYAIMPPQLKESHISPTSFSTSIGSRHSVADVRKDTPNEFNHTVTFMTIIICVL